MKTLRNLPIKRKLTAITMLASGLALVLACMAFVAYEQMTFRRSMVRDLSITAEMTGANSAAGLTFSDASSVEQTLKSLSAHPHIMWACVYGKDGKVFATYQRTDLKGRFVPLAMRDDFHEFGGDHLDLFHKVSLAGETIGTVYVASDLRELEERFVRYGVIVSIVLVVSILAAFFLSSKLQKIISEPIFHLAKTAAAVAEQKDYSLRALKHGEDELGGLIDRFNDMLAQIQKQDSALQEARGNLERRVEERTRELQEEVAERQQAEAALRSSETRIRLIVDTAFDAIITCDSRGSILEWNAQAEKTFGWSREEALGRNLTETIIPERYRDAHRRGLERFLSSGEALILNRRMELAALNKTGGELPVELAVSPVRINEVFMFNAFLRDITERKEAEAKLEAVHKQLVDASRQAGMAEVATGVLHNVGNVLNSVNVTATLLTEKVKKAPASDLRRVVSLLQSHRADLGAYLSSDSKGQQVLDFLDQLAEWFTSEQSSQLQELDSLRNNIAHIKDIVAMQQSYAKVSGIIETIKVTDLLEDALRMNAGALSRHNVQVIREYAEIPSINTDKHKVLQILVNLVRNGKYACKESGREDKRLTVRATNADGKLRIAVIDNGVGIAQENLTKIFHHGFTTKREGHGFGLHSGALAARELGGALNVHSDGPDKGAIFTLELPCEPTS